MHIHADSYEETILSTFHEKKILTTQIPPQIITC